MARLLDQKVNGRYPQPYVPAVETDLHKTFARIRRQQSQPAQPQEQGKVLNLKGAKR